ncbi:hypothetical protein [Pendulispora albinea]|uniref:PEGA domain-containing protein n=1 Tax=Pendulispora albinea TaxID=2741071 RepID=A0ABZ2LW00_9BACT
MSRTSSTLRRRTKRIARIATPVLVLALLSPLSRPAWAEDRAAAEALFKEGRELMAAGNYDLACPKFERSRALDPGIGTAFNLAMCYEAQGRIASAWSTYGEVVAATQASGQPERERVARARAKALEPRIAYLTIVVAQPAPSTEPVSPRSVYLDGNLVNTAQWGVPIPTDPGAHEIVASAMGRDEFRRTVHVQHEGQRTEIIISDLPPEKTATAPSASPPAKRPISFARAPAPEPPTRPVAVPLVVGAVGLAALGIGAYFGVRSISQNGDADPNCAGNVCDDKGYELRQSAITSGNVSTVFVSIGAVAVVSAIGLWLFLPSKPPPSPKHMALQW